MDIEQLKMVAEIIGKLGSQGQYCFIAFLLFEILRTLLICLTVAFGLYVVPKAFAKGLRWMQANPSPPSFDGY